MKYKISLPCNLQDLFTNNLIYLFNLNKYSLNSRETGTASRVKDVGYKRT